MTTKNNKKNNSARKIIPAAGMLMVSALMLSTSTYAWFTMSREVEVTNISMSATVPEDIQISLGRIGTIDNGTISASTKETDASLANGKGGLVNTSGAVADPELDLDWSNIADVSEYYQFGKLIPASSTNGTNIYFTPDANGVGKTVSDDARYYAAALGGTAQPDKASGDNVKNRNATAHIINSKNGATVNDTWNTTSYVTAAGWDNTYDDGYYIDIPVWFRTSSKDGANLSVKAYVKPRSATNNTTDGEALYRAVRVAMLEVGSGDSGTTYTNKTNLIPIADGCSKGENGAAVGSLRANPFALTVDSTNYNILNWYTRETGKEAVKELGTSPATQGVYDEAVQYQANATVVALTGPTVTSASKESQYGAAKKFIIRVWLEGEDPDCWNATAGQDWSINLKFNNETTASGGGADTDIAGVNQGTAPKQAGNNNQQTPDPDPQTQP